MPSTASLRFEQQKKVFNEMAEGGEGLVAPDPTLTEKVAQALPMAAAGVTLVTLLNAAPASAAEASAPAPVVRIMGSEIPIGHTEAKASDPVHTIRILGTTIEFHGSPAKPKQNSDVTVRHLIEPGDTLSQIAVDHNDKVPDLAMRNKITNVDLIFAGDTIEVKTNGNPNQPVAAVSSDHLTGAPKSSEAAATLTVAPALTTEAPAAEVPVPAPEIAQPSPTVVEAVVSPAPESTPPPPPPAPEVPAPSLKLSELFNVNAIPDNFNGFGGVQIRADIIRLMDVHGIAPNGAAQLSGTFLQEAGNDHRAENRKEGGYGLISAHGNRRVGMPTESREAQIDFIITQMQDRYLTSYLVLANRESTPAQVRDAIKDFIGYGDEGNRTTWGHQLAYFLHVPKGEQPKPTFSMATVPAPAPQPTPPPQTAPAPQPAPAPVVPVVREATKAVTGSLDKILDAAATEVVSDIKPSLDQDRYGYVQLHPDPEQRYVSYSGPEDQWGTAELIGTIQQGSVAFHSLTGDQQTHVGDLNERERGEHLSHRNGVDVDFYALGSRGAVFNMDRAGYNSALTIEYGKILLQTRDVEFIFFNDPVVIRELNKFAAENKLPGQVQYAKNHRNHAHLRVNAPEGPRVR